MVDFKDAILLLDDVGSKLYKQKNTDFTSGRQYKIQMIVMCH